MFRSSILSYFKDLEPLERSTRYRSPKDNAKPIALHAARNVPLPLRTKVRDELKRRESMGVISAVSEPSLWCSGMVVVLKLSGQVRICVDLRHLNQNVQQEFHSLPRVEETLAQLTGARVFTKLDEGSGRSHLPEDCIS